MQLAVSSYSFSRFGAGPEPNEKPDFHQLVDTCATLGLSGLELLGVHFTHEDPAYLADLRRHAFRRGIAIVSVSAHHNFVQPDPTRRQEEIQKLLHWIEVAAALGAGAVRAFGGRWATRPRFAEFMAAGGVEPPIEGYTVDDGYAWSAEAFAICARRAEELGVTIALENHWGFTGTADGVLRILADTPSPALRVVLDTGNFNFSDDPYGEMAKLIPYTAMVHAKTYIGGGIYYTAELDYPRIFSMLRDADFTGYVSIEFEGRAHPSSGVPQSCTELLTAFNLGRSRAT